jgi:hypothetical protein
MPMVLGKHLSSLRIQPLKLLIETEGLWLQQYLVLAVPLAAVSQPCQMIPIPERDSIFTSYLREAVI